ncbi:predicted protein [Postia placenta Mad-698-R]|nr:predicted protein [Postia placenta Mad-698-R]
MARRRTGKPSPVKASISTATDGMAAMEKPATTSSKNKRSTSDTPYGASGENEAPGRPLIASPQCEAAQGDAKDGQTTSGESSRMAEDGKPSPVRVDATGVRQGPAGDTSTSAFPEAAGGSAPAQPTKEVKSAINGKVESRGREDEKPEDPWSLCADEAGLFSTILAAFLAAFYLLLGPQTPDATAQVLVVITVDFRLGTRRGEWERGRERAKWADCYKRVGARHRGVGSARSTPQAPKSNKNLTKEQQTILDTAIATTQPTTTTISTGVLWFIALIFSLSAASISIAVGQWLHHHTDRASSLSRQSVRIWYLRRRGAQRWHVQAIIDILPILLQISLALNIRGTLDVVGEYFSSSGAEEVARTESWSVFTYLLDAFVELARVDIARPARDDTLFTRDVVNALEHCASRCPIGHYLTRQIRCLMKEIYNTLGYFYGSSNATQPVAEVTISSMPTPREDVDEAPRQHPRAIDGASMV